MFLVLLEMISFEKIAHKFSEKENAVKKKVMGRLRQTSRMRQSMAINVTTTTLLYPPFICFYRKHKSSQVEKYPYSKENRPKNCLHDNTPRIQNFSGFKAPTLNSGLVRNLRRPCNVQALTTTSFTRHCPSLWSTIYYYKYALTLN